MSIITNIQRILPEREKNLREKREFIQKKSYLLLFELKKPADGRKHYTLFAFQMGFHYFCT